MGDMSDQTLSLRGEDQKWRRHMNQPRVRLYPCNDKLCANLIPDLDNSCALSFRQAIRTNVDGLLIKALGLYRTTTVLSQDIRPKFETYKLEFNELYLTGQGIFCAAKSRAFANCYKIGGTRLSQPQDIILCDYREIQPPTAKCPRLGGAYSLAFCVSVAPQPLLR